MNLDNFTRGYCETALWSSYDSDGIANLDDDYCVSDIHPDTLTRITADCEAFQRDNAALLEGFDSGRAGHDFWLTRNWHGAGFWDGDYPDAVGKALTDASHVYGEYNLYVGDDGMIHGERG